VPAMYHSCFGYATSTIHRVMLSLTHLLQNTHLKPRICARKNNPSVIRNRGYGPVRGDKQPPINEGEK